MLKALLIFGFLPENDIDQINSYSHKINSLTELYNQKDYYYHIFKNSDSSKVQDENFLLTEKEITPYTRIDFILGGALIHDIYYLKLGGRFISIPEIFHLFSYTGNNLPINLHLWANYANEAIKYLNILPQYSFLSTHNIESIVGFDLALSAIKSSIINLKKDDKLLNPFQAAIKNVGVENWFTSQININVNDQILSLNKQSINISEILLNPKKILNTEQINIISFYKNVQKTISFTYYSSIDIVINIDLNYPKNEENKENKEEVISKKVSDKITQIQTFYAFANFIDNALLNVSNMIYKYVLYILKSAQLIISFLKTENYYFDDMIENHDNLTTFSNKELRNFKVGRFINEYTHNKIEKNFLTENKEIIKNIINKDIDFTTPLIAAVNNTNLTKVIELLENGANPNINGNGDISPLMLAIQSGNVQITKELINNGAETKCYIKHNKITPLLMASSAGHLDIVRYLLENKKSDISEVNIRGENALHHASMFGHNEIIIFLLKYGADINKLSNIGLPPIIYALINEHREVVRLFANCKNYIEVAKVIEIYEYFSLNEISENINNLFYGTFIENHSKAKCILDNDLDIHYEEIQQLNTDIIDTTNIVFPTLNILNSQF